MSTNLLLNVLVCDLAGTGSCGGEGGTEAYPALPGTVLVRATRNSKYVYSIVLHKGLTGATITLASKCQQLRHGFFSANVLRKFRSVNNLLPYVSHCFPPILVLSKVYF